MALIVEYERAERRFRSSGGRLRGCVSGSSLLRRLEVLRSEACLECRNWRGEDLASRGGSDRDDFLGDFEDDLDFVGEGGSEADG